MPRNYTLRIRGPADGSYTLSADSGAVAVTGVDAALTYAQGGGDLLLDIRWDTALGTSQNATSDGGVATIDEGGSGGQVLAVESPDTYGWDAHGPGNVLSILQTADSWGHVRFDEMFPLPVDGEEQFWAMRFYHFVETGVDEDQGHPHCLWPVGAIEAIPLGVKVTTGGHGAGLGSTEWLPDHTCEWGGSGEDAPFPFGTTPKDASGNIAPLNKGEWYRFEYIFHWRNATEFRSYPRVYDMDGNLIFDEYDYKHTDTNDSLGDWYDADPDNQAVRTANSSDPDNIRAPSFGRGQTNPDSGFHYCVAAARFELRTAIDDFIGPVS